MTKSIRESNKRQVEKEGEWEKKKKRTWVEYLVREEAAKAQSDP
jgi:hypothetical protein